MAGYELNIRNIMLLYTNNKAAEREIKKTTAPERFKCLGINWIKEVKDLYPEHKRHWWKKLKMTQTHGKIYLAHGLEELILLKSPYYSKPSTDPM